MLEQVVAARGDYLRVVATLREALDLAASQPEDPDDGLKTRQELLVFPPGEKGTRMPTTEQVAGRLAEFEKAIRSERVPVDADKAILWVDATLDGKAGKTMVVDFDAEDVRLPARVAAEVGVRAADDEPAIEITTTGGRTILARRARIATVQVGPVTASDVECLVLPEGYGEAPALLGGSFLKRFATRFDPETGTLVLTQVQVKSIGRAARTATPRAAAPPP